MINYFNLLKCEKISPKSLKSLKLVQLPPTDAAVQYVLGVYLQTGINNLLEKIISDGNRSSIMGFEKNNELFEPVMTDEVTF